MLRPASLYKEEIEENFKALQYTKNMFFGSGDKEPWLPEIFERPAENVYQYAVVDKEDNLKGFISFKVDWHAMCAYAFGLMSFDHNSLQTASGLNEVMDMLINEWNMYRIEWRMVGGNPAQKAYDRFMKKYNGKKLVFTDVCRDWQGNYHDDIIYEILIPRNKK